MKAPARAGERSPHPRGNGRIGDNELGENRGSVGSLSCKSFGAVLSGG